MRPLADGVPLARGRGLREALLVLRCLWEPRGRLVVPSGHGVLELAHALPDRPADLGDALRAEEEEHHDEEDQELRKPDSEGHSRRLAAVSALSVASGPLVP